ncbi:MAG: GerW family sporulation protein [bacterium]|nr:GerW family sporulation protein [bacterium]
MAENDFSTEIKSLFQGMDSFVSSKTVVGEPIHVGDTILLPLIEVSFGMAAGSFCDHAKKNNGAGGLSAKMSPSAMLVIQNGMTKLVSIKNQDVMSKILDMVPDFVNRFAGFSAGEVSEEAVDAAKEELKKAEEKKEN